MEKKVKIAELSVVRRGMLVDAMEYATKHGEKFLVGFDETDQSIKWKVGNGPWSPPVKTEER